MFNLHLTIVSMSKRPLYLLEKRAISGDFFVLCFYLSVVFHLHFGLFSRPCHFYVKSQLSYLFIFQFFIKTADFISASLFLTSGSLCFILGSDSLFLS